MQVCNIKILKHYIVLLALFYFFIFLFICYNILSNTLKIWVEPFVFFILWNFGFALWEGVGNFEGLTLPEAVVPDTCPDQHQKKGTKHLY